MNEKILYVMSGIPASGKSYWSRIKVAMEDAYYVSRDKVRFEIMDKYEEFEGAECEYFTHETEVFDTYVAEIQNAINDKFQYIIADATHLNHKSRNKLLRRLNLHEYQIVVVFLETPLETCLKRNSKRVGRAKVPETIIKNMYNSIEYLTDEEIDKGYKMVVINGG